MKFVQMIQYLTLILKSYSQGRKFFIDNLISEQKEARKDDLVSIIDDVEFFYNCKVVVEILKNKLDGQYHGKEMELFEDIYIDDLTLNLNDFTNGELNGILKWEDLEFMEIAITIAGRYVNYLERKQFGFKKLELLWNYGYKGFLSELKSFKISFDVIKNKLPLEQSFEFVNDFLDQLKELEQLQNISKFKLLIKNTIADIENENAELLSPSLLEINELPQQTQDANSDEVKAGKASNELHNPYPEIFTDGFSFQLFKRLHENYKDSNTRLADFSFIYRKMYGQDGKYIRKYQKPEMFRNWLSNEPFNLIVDSKFKTLDNCKTNDKETNFNTIIELVRKEYGSIP